MLRPMGEQIGFVLVLTGVLTATAGCVWTLARGLALAARRRRPRQLLPPLVLLSAGLVLGALPFAYQRVFLQIVGLGERERWIDGDRAVTLTGWDRGNYDVLRDKPDTVILEMGNPDVTDATLRVLDHLPRLRELTLNDSSVTDDGLATLARLPALETLRLARTRITPEGLRRFLDAPPAHLRQIDVSGNGIPTGILRQWKNASLPPQGDGTERRYVN